MGMNSETRLLHGHFEQMVKSTGFLISPIRRTLENNVYTRHLPQNLIEQDTFVNLTRFSFVRVQPEIAFSNLAPLESSIILTRFAKFQALKLRAGRTWSSCWQQRNRRIQSRFLYTSFEGLHQQFELYVCKNFLRGDEEFQRRSSIRMHVGLTEPER